MSLFDRLLNKNKKTTLYDELTKYMEPVIVKKYRDVGILNICAPTSKTSDQKIIEIYKRVLFRFKEASYKKGEHIPANNLNYIAFIFMQFYESYGDKGLEEHLDLAIILYEMRVLRKEYKENELSLF